MNSFEKLKQIAVNNGGIITTSEAGKNNISRSLLYKFCKEGKIERIAAGQYILQSDIQDELYSLALRSNKFIFSHETALFLHGLSDRTPFEHTVTIATDSSLSEFLKRECKVYYIKPDLFELGKISINTQFGNTVSAYNLERTVCDLIRSRNRIGTETLLAALKAYSLRTDKNLNILYDYAKQLRVLSALRQYMEVLL